jgi:hypothetical protein
LRPDGDDWYANLFVIARLRCLQVHADTLFPALDTDVRVGTRERLLGWLSREPEDQLRGFYGDVELWAVADPVECHPVGMR